MVRLIKVIGLCAIVCMPILMVGQVSAQEIGSIRYIEGRVDILKPDSDHAILVREYTPVSVGDFVRTKSGSKAEIVFADNSVMQLAENSRIEIKDFTFDQNKRRLSALIVLDRGKTHTVVTKTPHFADFIIATPNAEAVTGDSDLVAFYQAGNSGVMVSNGSLSVRNPAHPEKTVKVSSGSTAVISLESPPTEPRQYFEVEKKLHLADTQIPLSVAKRNELDVLTGTVTKFSGEVKIAPKGAQKSHQVKTDEVVQEGDRVETGSDGAVAIMFGNGCGIFLKADSNVLITKLIMDRTTGEYENLFESDKGKLKGLIEKMGGKSRFEIKTPTAVCGARGTIMYLTVSPASTSVFFEGGHGYMTNALSGETTSLGSGQQGITNGGASTVSSQISGAQDRLDLEAGFLSGGRGGGNPIDDAEDGGGYSGGGSGGSPGGDSAFYTPAPEGPSLTSGVYIPVTEEIGFVAEPSSDGTSAAHGVQAGDMFYAHLNEGEPQLAIDGGVYDVAIDCDYTELWSSSVGVPFTILGGFDTGTTSSVHIWTTDQVYSYDPAAGSYTTPDGGAFYGFVGGQRSSAGIVGALVALYIDPNGMAGILKGTCTGSDVEFFALDGTDLAAYVKGSGLPIAPAELYQNIDNNSNFFVSGTAPDGSMSVNCVDGTALSIYLGESAHAGWGIWGSRFAGSHYSALPGEWTIQASGQTFTNGTVDGGIMVLLSGSADGAGVISGGLSGIVLTVHADGSFAELSSSSCSGDIFGTYVDAGEGLTGTWQAVGLGEWVDAGVMQVTESTTMDALGSFITNLPVSIPITEAMSITGMSGSGPLGADGIVSVSAMNVNFYASTTDPNQLNGIWASLIQGSFVPPTAASNTWMASVSAESGSSATLVGTQWSNGTWQANVVGNTSGGQTTFTGTAAGNYNDSNGTFQGVGAGNWETTPQSETIAG